jgi:hypothetical protein
MLHTPRRCVEDAEMALEPEREDAVLLLGE